MTRRLMVAWSILVFAVINYAIWDKEQTLANGETVLLALAPVDPRSLMQGDYMRLRYEIENVSTTGNVRDFPRRGYLVVRVDEQSVGHFVRFYGGGTLREDERLIRYHRVSRVQVVPNSFLFQEGLATLYQRAAFGVFKLDSKGRHVLAGLADANRQLIKPESP